MRTMYKRKRWKVMFQGKKVVRISYLYIVLMIQCIREEMESYVSLKKSTFRKKYSSSYTLSSWKVMFYGKKVVKKF